MSWEDELIQEIRRLEGRRLKRAGAVAARRMKYVLSVPAPRVRVLAKRGKYRGSYYYRATTPATPGAPPRKLSGRGRASVTYEVNEEQLTVRLGSNVIYMARHERGNHKWARVALEQARIEIKAILGGPFTIGEVQYGPSKGE